ncbi:MAG: peptidase E [Candidatus Moraniibacteriota bacterium]
MKTIVAIGGGELKDLETLPIDRAIVKLAKKKHPKALFIPTASNDAMGYWETFQSVYGKKLGCETDVLFLIREKLSSKQVKEKILSSDIIYVGGGNTLRMLRTWKKYGVDRLLREAYEKGAILSGLSAGAIAWFRYGSSDSRWFVKNGKQVESFMRVSALGLLPFTVSPHHVREKKLRDPGIKEIMMRTPGVALALDDNAAILVQGDRFEILRSKPSVGIRKVFRKEGKIKEVSLKDSGTLEDLSVKNE